MKKLLFLSHDATRTGAPILLLNLFEALQDDFEIHFLLKGGGDLTETFKRTSKTFIATSNEKQNKLSRLITKFKRKRIEFNLKGIEWDSYDCIVSNTITNGDILPFIRAFYKGPIFSYIHELEMATNFFTDKKNLSNLVEFSTSFLVPSNAVKKHLVENIGIPEELVKLLHYYIPISNKPIEDRSSNEFIIGGIGTSDWRKSPDIFILIARLLFIRLPEAKIKFIWKGAAMNSVEMDRLNYDLKKTDLQNRVEFLPPSSNMDDTYRQLKVLLLTSREDPYPLVTLEAANYGIPTICFEGAGGAPEFIHMSNAGFAVPFLDINEAVEKIIFYYNNPQDLISHSEKVKKTMLSTHHNKNYIFEQFKERIRNMY